VFVTLPAGFTNEEHAVFRFRNNQSAQIHLNHKIYPAESCSYNTNCILNFAVSPLGDTGYTKEVLGKDAGASCISVSETGVSEKGKVNRIVAGEPQRGR